MRSLHLGAIGAALLLVGCGVRTSTSVSPAPGATPGPANAASTSLPAKSPDQIIVTEGDITDRPYRTLGDIKVHLEKWGAFDKDPTPAMVNEALKKKAAQMGADAVVLARYGTVGIGFTSWGVMDGEGRAVVFTQ